MDPGARAIGLNEAAFAMFQLLLRPYVNGKMHANQRDWNARPRGKTAFQEAQVGGQTLYSIAPPFGVMDIDNALVEVPSCHCYHRQAKVAVGS